MPIYAWKEMWEAYKSSLISVWHKDMDRCSCRHPCIFTDARSKNKGKKPNQSQSVKSKPSETPEDIRQVSVSFLGVVIRLWPGLLIKQNQMDQFQKHRAFFLKKEKKEKATYLLSRSNCKSDSESGIRGGHPSIIQPTPPPWDSPKVETRKWVPYELPVACISANLEKPKLIKLITLNQFKKKKKNKLKATWVSLKVQTSTIQASLDGGS